MNNPTNTIPHNAHSLENEKLWIFGFGTLYNTKAAANKDKDQVVREYVKQYEFFGKVWYIRQSAHAIKSTEKMGYKPIN